MKLDKVRFATLIGYLSRITGTTFAVSEIVEIDDIIDMPIPEVPQGRAAPEDIERLMMLMAAGNQKVEAIKQYRMLTDQGLKESKDAVEKYWLSNALVNRAHFVAIISQHFANYEIHAGPNRVEFAEGLADKLFK